MVGLGNPGSDYEDSRHNLGCKAVDLLGRKRGRPLTNRRFQALSTSIDWHDKRMFLSCPQTYMNRSGRAVKELMDYHRLEVTDIMVVHDDIDLDLGRIRIVKGGGAGGHHGVESVIYYLGTQAFNRTKIGIGRPRFDQPIEDFVLSPLYEDQRKVMEEVLHVVVGAIELFVLEGVEAAMNKFNSPAIGEKG